MFNQSNFPDDTVVGEIINFIILYLFVFLQMALRRNNWITDILAFIDINCCCCCYYCLILHYVDTKLKETKENSSPVWGLAEDIMPLGGAELSWGGGVGSI